MAVLAVCCFSLLFAVAFGMPHGGHRDGGYHGDSYNPGFKRTHNGVQAVYKNDDRQRAVNKRAEYVGASSGTARIDDVPGTNIDFVHNRYGHEHGSLGYGFDGHSHGSGFGGHSHGFGNQHGHRGGYGLDSFSHHEGYSGGLSHGSHPHGGNSYAGNPHGGNSYGGNPHGGNSYGGHPHGGNPHGGHPHGGNPHGGHPHGGHADQHYERGYEVHKKVENKRH